MTRYVLKIEPLASASVDEVVRLAAPAIAATLQGEEALTAVVPEQTRGRRLRVPRLPGAGVLRRPALPGRARA
ncbi:hypothetical protein G5V59_03380 [Nocardioides sp. W3-2-3]|uniref:TetR/AcrR family transcriptional regulator n=1 Tax=Nocardioides convexus TaxID=2712224 RepID=UPI00310193D5|nr:hypothetical protein [Nocardioides convexus]